MSEYVLVSKDTGTWVYCSETGEAVAFCSYDVDKYSRQEFLDEVEEDFEILLSSQDVALESQ